MYYVLSVDQSTSATKAYLWDEQGRQTSGASILHRQIINERGWVEHDPREILRNVLLACRNAITGARVDPAAVVALGISNQRETVVCWDAVTGEPLYNAVVWQCGRASELVRSLEADGVAETVRAISGLPLSPFFSAAKLGWLVKNVSEVQDAMTLDRLRVGTIDAWLVDRLCGQFRTDLSNASRTQLLNLDTLQWDEELLRIFGLRGNCLPELCMSDSLFGETDLDGLLPREIPLHGVLGDSHAALLFNRCFAKGQGKVTYGTGSSVMLNAGKTRPRNAKGLATSLAWARHNTVSYALEGNINYAAATLNWMCDDLGLVERVENMEALAAGITDTGGVYLVPAFSGLGAPWFDNSIRAGIVGMNRTTRKAQVVRAALESIAYQVTDVVDAMTSALGTPPTRLCADGGPTHNGFLMQFQADMLRFPLYLNRMSECSAAGAALCAAEASGFCNPEQTFRTGQSVVVPKESMATRDQRYLGWLNAIHTLQDKGAPT